MAKKPQAVPDSSVEIIPPAKRPVGRPSLYSQELAEEICLRVSLGRAVEEIAKDDDMPGERTIYQWKARHPEFAQALARAREDMASRWAEKILDIACTAMSKEKSVEYDPRMLRVAIDGFDKFARLRMGRPAVDGPASATLVQNNYTKIDVASLDPDQRDQLKQVLLAAKRASEGGA
jgi:hypothetical protein